MNLSTLNFLSYENRATNRAALPMFALFIALQLAALPMLVCAAGLGLFSATRWRARIDRAISERNTLGRAELYSVCQLLAVYLRTGDTPSVALDRLTARTTGVIPGELADAANRIRAGSPAALVMERLADDTTEPAAARLYRAVGSTWATGGDPDGLLALADDLRNSRREELARTMTKRNTAMVLPLVAGCTAQESCKLSPTSRRPSRAMTRLCA